ncbi:MAG: MFS transporter [Chloroflexota bacterium]
MTSKTGMTTKTIGYYAAFITLGLSLGVLGPTLPALANKLNTDISMLGILFTAREIGTMLTALFGARLYDRFPGHRIMTIGLFSVMVLMALVPFLSTVWILSFVVLLMGLFAGAIDVGANTLLVWLYQDRVAPFMNGLHFFYGVGAFLAPTIVGLMLVMDGGLQKSYWILALIMLPIMLYMARLPSPEHPKVSHEEANEKVNYVLVFFIALFLFLYVAAEAGYGGWISSYAVLTRLGTESAAAYLASAYWGSFTIGRLLGVPAAMRFPPERILYVTLIAGLFFIILLAVFPLSVEIIWIGTCCFGLTTGPIFATAVALAGRRLRLTGRVTGLIFLGASLGAMIVPWLIGLLFPVIGPQVLFYAILITIGADIVVLLGINKIKGIASNRKDFPVIEPEL